MEIVHVLLDLLRLHERHTRASKKKIQNSVDKIADLTYKQQQNGEKNRIFFDKAIWHAYTHGIFNFFVLIGNRILGTSSKHARNSNNTGDLVGACGRLVALHFGFQAVKHRRPSKSTGASNCVEYFSESIFRQNTPETFSGTSRRLASKKLVWRTA